MSNTRVVLFASLREELGAEGVEIKLTEAISLPAFIDLLEADQGPAWRQALTAENIRIAVNQELISGDVVINNGDEVAFFPPVTGG